MLGETNTKSFADVTVNEGITLVLIIGVLFFLDVSNYRFDYAKSGRNFNSNKQN
jgi:hypothetical protein